MKFSDGQWHDRQGLTVNGAAEVNDIRTGPDSLTVFAPYKAVSRRGDTLNAPMLTVRFSSPMQDVIRVQLYHFKGAVKKGPEFSLNIQNDVKVDIEDNESEASLTAGGLSVRIRKKGGWSVDYIYGGRNMTGSGSKSMACITDLSGNTYMREQLSLGVGECVYGLGERFTPFVRNGQVVDIWNEDGGTNSEQAYKNIPFYITNRGYGVLVNHPELVSFEVASEKVEKVQFSVMGQYLEYLIIGGCSMKDVLRNYTALTGKPALPPAWSFGLWLTTSFTTSYDEDTVNGFIDGMFKRDLPLHVFHFDCFWMKEFQWCDFEWDKDVFPDPEGMLKRLKDKGLKICVWINPYIAQKSRLFDEGMENGYLVKTENGDVWQWDRWQAGMGLVDFTNPDACRWFAGKLKRLINMGVDCFKTDFGERIPTGVEYYDGSDPFKMHNYYTYLYNRTVFEVLKETKGEKEALVFARSATVGGQQFPVHWGGDCTASYASMAESLRGGLSLCLSGFGFWSHDISGFEKTATPDVYKRWTAFGLLSTHSRLHGNESYRVPWLFDDEAVDVLRFFTKLKCSLMPYLYGAACEASRGGIPMMRAMVLEFDSDPACDCLDRQYMLGGSLLVAPVFSGSGDVAYYLPEGKWTNLITGEMVEGGCWRTENHGYLSIPLMARPNSIIATGSNDEKPDYDFADGVIMHVFNLEDGSEASAAVYNMAGENELEVWLRRNGSVIEVESKSAGKPWSLLLRGVSALDSVYGGSWMEGEDGVAVMPERSEGVFKIVLK